MGARYDSRHREWVLDVPPSTPPDALTHIPGLRWVGKVVHGSEDAIGVAEWRLGQTPHIPNRVVELFEHDALRPYQIQGVGDLEDMLRRAGGAVLADDPGLGKTRSAAVLATRRDGRFLVICPASVRETWRAELTRLGIPHAILGPPSSKRYLPEWEKAEQATCVVTSYELADRAGRAAFPKGGLKTLIIDEAQMLCGRRTKRRHDLAPLAALASYKLLLTATPMWSMPRDFYSLLALLFGRAFGSAAEFDEAYCAGQRNDYGGMENKGVSRLDELKLRLSYYMVRRTKAEVASELPKLTRQVVWIDEDATASAALVQHLANPTKGSFYAALEAALEAKIPEAVRLAVQARSFLLTTYTRDHAARIAALVEAAGVPAFVITGDLPHPRRSELVSAAKAAGGGVVATIDSLAVGVDGLQHLTSYGIAHWLDPTPNKLIQMEGRLDRIGQSLPINWVYLAQKESADELVIARAVLKLDAAVATTRGTEVARGLRDALADGPDQEQVARSLYDLLPED